MSRTVLLATAEPALSGAALASVSDAEAASVSVVTGQASLDALLAAGAPKFSSAVVVVASGTASSSLAPSFLGAVAKALQPGGTVAVKLEQGAAATQVRGGGGEGGWIATAAEAARDARCARAAPLHAWMLRGASLLSS